MSSIVWLAWHPDFRRADANGEIVVARKLARDRLVGFFSELPQCVVAMALVRAEISLAIISA